MEASHRSLVARRCRRNLVQAEDDGRKSIGKTRGQAGNCVPRGLTENAPVERFHSPIAGGLQPAGKGRAPSLTAVIRPRLPGAGAESRLPRGRQARPDLTRVKSGKKDRARHSPSDSSEPHHVLDPPGKACPRVSAARPDRWKPDVQKTTRPVADKTLRCVCLCRVPQKAGVARPASWRSA